MSPSSFFRVRHVRIAIFAALAGLAICLPASGPTLAISPINPPAAPTISSLLPVTLTVTQGASSGLTLAISASQATDTTVAVSSSAPGTVFVPSSVIVPAGQTSVVVAVSGNTPGTAQITASLNTSSATSSVTVTVAAPTVVSVLPPTTPLLPGASTSLTVTLSAAQPIDTVVALTASPTGIVSIQSSVTVLHGQTTAAVPVSAIGFGTAAITASLNGSTAQAAVQVTPPPPAVVSVVPSPLPIVVGASGALTVTLNAVQAEDTIVALSVDDNNLLQVLTSVLVPAGQLQASFAVTGQRPGSATVTATIGGSAKNALVRVVAPPPTVVSLIPNPFVLETGASGGVLLTLNAVQDTDTVVSLTNSSSGVVLAPASVIVPAGQLTATFPMTAQAQGTATISAVLHGASAATTIQVTTTTIGLGLTPATATLTQGTPGSLRLSVLQAPLQPTVVTLSSDVPTVASVPASVTIAAGALSADFPVFANHEGAAIITATLNARSSAAQVIVTAAELVSLAITPRAPTVVAGGSQAFAATGTLSDGSIRDVSQLVNWLSSASAVATINASGVASALATGTATITAMSGSISASTTLTVAPGSGLPTITGFAPTQGPVGTTIVITGTNFDPTAANNQVRFNGLPAPVTSATPTSLTTTVPLGATTGPISVTTAGGTAQSAMPFTVTQPTGIGKPVTGLVLTAKDAKPMAGVRLTLGNQSTITDATGSYTFASPPSGYQLITVDHHSLDQFPTPGHWHAHSILINISMTQDNPAPYPMYVVEAHPTLYPITPGRSAVIAPAHIPEFRMMIPDGVTIRGDDGQPNTKVAITSVRLDRVPPLPPQARARSVYLVSFDKPGGGIPNQPIPVTLPNDQGAPPGARVTLWFYEKSPLADPKSHQWKQFGEGTVSPDGKRIVPDPGVGQPQFCEEYFNWPGGTYNPVSTDPKSKAGEPVDTSSGVFSFQKTDLVLPGVLPVTITRTYRTLANAIAAFGYGTQLNYNIYVSLVGQAVILLMPDGNRYTFSSEADGKYHNRTYPLWQGATISFVTDHYVLRMRDGMTYVFYPSGYLKQQIDRYNNQITITRDTSTTFARDTITQITNPAGQALTFSYVRVNHNTGWYLAIASITDPLGRVVRYTYDTLSNGRLASVTDPAGDTTSYTYGVVNLSSWVYDPAEGLVSITDAKGITFLKNDYDSAGRVIKQTQADGSTYNFAYTLAGQTITQTTVTDPRGNATTYVFNASQQVTQINAPGQTTQYGLDASTNNLLTLTDALNHTTNYTYDSNGNTLTVTDANNKTTTFTYEPTFNRVATITDALNQVTSFTYDSNGNLLTTTDPLNHTTTLTYNTAGQVLTVKDPLNNTTTFTYDAQGNLSTTTDPLGNATQRTYDAVSRLLSVLDPRGKLTRYGYDPVNRVTQIQDPLSGLTAFTYDTNGNLLTVKDAKAQTTTYTYDTMDRLTTRKDALANTETYTYDLAGNLATFTDRKANTTTYTYDSLNRRTQAAFQGGATTTFNYDAQSRLTSLVDSVGGTITYGYDIVNRLTSETTALGTIAYTYDAIGRRATMTVNGGTAVTYTYDTASRLTQVAQGSQIVGLGYDTANRRTSLTYPNGVVTSYSYDIASRLTNISHVKAPTTIESMAYVYDPAGNRTSITRANAAATVQPPAVTTTLYNANNQQLKFNPPSGSNNLTYDLNGNLLTYTDASGTTTYTWDVRNRLTAISGPGLTASFTYDGLNRRKAKTINSVTTNYQYDGNDTVAETGATTANYVRSLGIDEPFIRQGATNEFYHTDALGSSLALTDASGVAQTTYTFEPFGKTTVTGTSTNSSQYTGRENDGTGLLYYRARYYSPTLQRFLREDPIRFTGGGINFYAYVGNNPINGMDPFGLLTVHIWHYQGSTEAWGHASITLDNGTHISWWPNSDGREHTFGESIPIYSAPANNPQLLRDDIRLEGGRPDVEIVLNGLDEAAIETWWNTYRQNNRWKTFGRNCATTVSDALKAGGGGSWWWWSGHNLVWTPNNAEAFALAIKEDLAKAAK